MVYLKYFLKFTIVLFLMLGFVFIQQIRNSWENNVSVAFSRPDFSHLQRCPCLHQPNLDESIDVVKNSFPEYAFPPLLICIFDEVSVHESTLKNITWLHLQGISELNVFFIEIKLENFEFMKGCDAMIRLVNSDTEKVEPMHCPGRCFPLPYFMIRYDTWKNLSYESNIHANNDTLLSCTLSLGMVREVAMIHNATTRKRFIGLSLTLMALHRLSECNENQQWHHRGDTTQAFHPMRREVGFLLIWMASNSR